MSAADGSLAEATRRIAEESVRQLCMRHHEEYFAKEAAKGSFHADLYLPDNLKVPEYEKILKSMGYRVTSFSRDSQFVVRVMW